MRINLQSSLKAMSIAAGVLFGPAVGAQQVNEPAPTYKDIFISYYSPANVAAMAKYADQSQLGGFILWEFRGDMPYSDKQQSLLAQLPTNLNGSAPLIMGYWTNWSVYTDTADRAIEQPAYPVPGSLDRSSGNVVVNQDFSQKLNGMNVVTYAFLQAQTSTHNKAGKVGTLYFSDPWADLQKTGSTEQDKLCGVGPDPKNMSDICTFGWKSDKISDNENMGNFNAFAKLTRSNNELGPLKKVFSVGGYGHDAVFEDTFTNPTYINNFVTSAKKIIDAYGLDGIDLDYENPAMTHLQSTHYVELVRALREQLPDTFISVTILSDPNYLNGARGGDSGFATGTLAQIAGLVDHVNLMTYDFHGAFDYSADGKGTTGFLTNLHMPGDAPAHYRFSVDTSVYAALKLGIPTKKLSIGIPAYGRAIAGVSGSNGGLYQPILASSVGIPKGDLDPKNCNTTIPINPAVEACSGSFRYSYILKNMLGPKFVPTEHTAQGVSNGVTAYAEQWTQPVPVVHKLTLANKSSVGFNVTVRNNEGASFTPDQFFGLGYTNTYEPASIANQKGLGVFIKSYWPAEAKCDLPPLDFNADMTIEVTAAAEGNKLATCTVTKK